VASIERAFSNDSLAARDARLLPLPKFPGEFPNLVLDPTFLRIAAVVAVVAPLARLRFVFAAEKRSLESNNPTLPEGAALDFKMCACKHMQRRSAKRCNVLR